MNVHPRIPLAQKIGHLSRRRDELRRIRRAARQTAEGFSWSRHVDALLALYARVAEARA